MKKVKSSSVWIIAALIAFACAVFVLGLRAKSTAVFTEERGLRIISLSPGITETLFAIGAGHTLVAVSDYTIFPPPAQQLPTVGTGITPNYEAIARLRPTRIVSERMVHVQAESLERLARTTLLPWLSLHEIVESTRTLGELSGHPHEAASLADRLTTELSREPPAHAPRVLVVLGYGGARLSEVWFIKRNSLHGAALSAAGAQNAVDRDVPGLPRLSLQEVIASDPDAIIILSAESSLSAELSRSYVDEWRALEPLRAVRLGRIRVLAAPEAYVSGPRILDLVRRLRDVIRQFGPA